jgi:hypothetical protein
MPRSVSLLALVGLLGCSVGCGNETAPAAAGPGSNPGLPVAATLPEASKPPAADWRCGDFLTVAEGKALGLDSSHYAADKTQTALGLLCSMGALGFSIFPGDGYALLIEDLDRGVEQGALQAETGPTLGAASKWSSTGPMQSVMFLATSRRYALHITAADRAMIEKVARALDAKTK